MGQDQRPHLSLSENEDARALEDIDAFQLQDILDLAHIREINEAFAYAIGLASTVVDLQGNPITPLCNHPRVCQLIRRTPKGMANCVRSGSILGRRGGIGWCAVGENSPLYHRMRRSKTAFFLLKFVPIGLFCLSIGSCVIGLPISRPCGSMPLVHLGMLAGLVLFVYIPVVFLLFGGEESRERNRTRPRNWSCCSLPIILFLIFVAYPFLMNIEYTGRSANSAANADLKNAFIAAQTYFKDSPNGVIDLEKLKQNGFVANDGVRLVVLSGNKDTLSMKSYHQDGCGRVYYIDSEGRIEYRETGKNGSN